MSLFVFFWVWKIVERIHGAEYVAEVAVQTRQVSAELKSCFLHWASTISSSSYRIYGI